MVDWHDWLLVSHPNWRFFDRSQIQKHKRRFPQTCTRPPSPTQFPSIPDVDGWLGLAPPLFPPAPAYRIGAPLVYPENEWARSTNLIFPWPVYAIPTWLSNKSRTTTRSEEAPRRIVFTFSLKETCSLFIHHTTINFSPLDQSSLERQSILNNSPFSSA